MDSFSSGFPSSFNGSLNEATINYLYLVITCLILLYLVEILFDKYFEDGSNEGESSADWSTFESVNKLSCSNDANISCGDAREREPKKTK